MKTLKYIFSTIIAIALVWSCTEDEFDNLDFVNSATAPTNVAALFTITQDNTGLVSIAPSADGAVQFEINLGDGTANPVVLKAGEKSNHIYDEGTYTVGVLAKGITGLTTNFSKELVVSFQAPVFGTEPIIENDPAVSKKVNVTVADDAQFAMFFDVYFVEDGIETIITGNVGETVSYTYENPGVVDIKVVLKGGAIATAEFILNDFEVVEILQPIASASTPQNRDESNYVSLYSSVYNDITGTNFNPDWGQQWQGSGYAEFDLNGDKMLQYTNVSYQGIVLESPIDVSTMEFVHFDIWTADAPGIELSLISESNGEKPVWRDINADEWTSIDIPISEFTDQGLTVADIYQLKFVSQSWIDEGLASGTVFIDNFYFYKTATEFADLPITFDSAVETFEPFLDAEFAISADPEDAGNPVGMITNHGQGWGWEGIKLQLDHWIDVSVIPTMKLDFYSTTTPHSVMMKLEDSTSPLDGNGNPTVMEEVWVDLNETGWNELVFNFTSGGYYDTIVLFVDGGVYDISGTYYFDNVVNEEHIALPLTMDTPGQTFEPFLDAEFALAVDPDDANNSVGMITNYGQGWGWEGVSLRLDEWIDTSANSIVNIDFYNDGAAHDVLLKLEDSTSPLDGNGNPTVFEEVVVPVSNTGWSQLTFDFTSGGIYNTVVLFVDGGVYDITGTYYFDNISQPE